MSLSSRVKSLCEYSFVVTILWLGFVTAISFVETPLRFQPDIPRVHVLSIGHLVFHGLNYAEILFALLTLIGLVAVPWCRWCYTVAGSILLLLAFQTWMLFGILDERTLARINGESVADAPWHSIYIVVELVKLLLLVGLMIIQLRDFRVRLGRQISENSSAAER